MKFLILLIVISFQATQNPIKWEVANNWRIYKMPSHIGLRISLDSMPIYKSMPIESDRLRTYMKNIQEIKNVNPVWTGLYVGSCELNNIKHKILFSRYGGFFFDDNSKRYYQISEELREDWINFLNESSKLIDQNR